MFRLTPSRVLAPKSFEEVWLGSDKMKYLKWLLLQLAAPKTKIEGAITDDAFATMSEKLSTP
jgi:hypothetical protein